jgi:hypothetical protein
MCVTGWLAARVREHILIARVVMGLDRASFCCHLDNKAHLFRSCHGIIIFVGMESAFFLLLGVVTGNKVRIFLSYSCYMDKTCTFLLLGVFIIL